MEQNRPERTGLQLIGRLCFRLLPIQILLAAVGAVNGIVSSLFASNFVGTEAMGAIGLYGPANMFIGAVSTLLMGGSQILCGKHLGKGESERTGQVFSLNLVIAGLFGLLCAAVLAVCGGWDLTGFVTDDPRVRGFLNQYLLGLAIGVLPQVLSQQLAAFLSLENRARRTTAASVVYIVVNLCLNYLFVGVLRLEAFGLALAASLGQWVFAFLLAWYFLSGRSMLRFRLRGLRWRDSGEIVKIGAPGALGYGYQTLRGILVNMLVLRHVGAVGLSAFAASDAFLGIFWAIPGGMLAVSRMLISVSVGEEDRQTLQDIMRVMFRRYIPVLAGVSAVLIACARPITMLYYQDSSDPVFMMTVWAFRLLPLCFPLSCIKDHFVCYGQASGKRLLPHLIPVLDGVVCVAGFTAVLIPLLGMPSVFLANVLNGVVSLLVVLIFAWAAGRRFPRTMEELMVIPPHFGAREEERLDIAVTTAEEVVMVSRQVQQFCALRGLDGRRACLGALALEEMAGNVVSHGFTKDRRKHTVDIRVVCREGKLILRIKDDCIPFDPGDRLAMVRGGEDVTANVGIRMVYAMADEVTYRNILGLNVLTIHM